MIIYTEVIPSPNREVIAERLISDIKNGAKAFMMMQDDKHKKTSSIARYKKYNTEVDTVGKDEFEQDYINNFQSGYRELSEAEVSHLVKGLGKRYPCFHGWIATTFEPIQFLSNFPNGYGNCDHNTFLKGTANTFSYGIWGTNSISTKPYNGEDCCLSDLKVAAQQNDPWGYYHVVVPDNQITNLESLKNEITLRAKSVFHEHETELKKIGEGFECINDFSKRINLTPSAKKHFKKFGYVWNKALSESKCVILDKTTRKGNILRISADGGGQAALIPYIEIKIIGHMIETQPSYIVPPNVYISTKEDLERLLEICTPILEKYEKLMVPIVDDILGVCPEDYRQVLMNPGIRRIIMSAANTARFQLIETI